MWKCVCVCHVIFTCQMSIILQVWFVVRVMNWLLGYSYYHFSHSIIINFDVSKYFLSSKVFRDIRYLLLILACKKFFECHHFSNISITDLGHICGSRFSLCSWKIFTWQYSMAHFPLIWMSRLLRSCYRFVFINSTIFQDSLRVVWHQWNP